MPVNKWKKLSSKTVYRSPRFSINEDEVVLPDGSRGKYFYRVSRPGVAVIPFDGEKIYLVNQYRYPLGRRLWELPIGRSENNNFLAQAKKELREETGLRAKKWKFLGNFYPAPGSGNSQAKLFLAQGLSHGRHEREPGEADMYMKGFTLKEIHQMVLSGKIVDGWTLSALYLFELKFKI